MALEAELNKARHESAGNIAIGGMRSKGGSMDYGLAFAALVGMAFGIGMIFLGYLACLSFATSLRLPRGFEWELLYLVIYIGISLIEIKFVPSFHNIAARWQVSVFWFLIVLIDVYAVWRGTQRWLSGKSWEDVRFDGSSSWTAFVAFVIALTFAFGAEPLISWFFAFFKKAVGW